MTYRFCSLTPSDGQKGHQTSTSLTAIFVQMRWYLAFCNASRGLQHTIFLASLNCKPTLPCWPPWHQLCLKLLCSKPWDLLSWEWLLPGPLCRDKTLLLHWVVVSQPSAPKWFHGGIFPWSPCNAVENTLLWLSLQLTPHRTGFFSGESMLSSLDRHSRESSPTYVFSPPPVYCRSSGGIPWGSLRKA